MKPKAKQDDYKILDYVTTLAGASRLVGKHANQISLAIDTGCIAAKRVGGNVLVSIPSLLSYYKIQ